jgi:hypothetical protein
MYKVKITAALHTCILPLHCGRFSCCMQVLNGGATLTQRLGGAAPCTGAQQCLVHRRA